jgi:outer membrane protein, heavy metal efflux system
MMLPTPLGEARRRARVAVCFAAALFFEACAVVPAARYDSLAGELASADSRAPRDARFAVASDDPFAGAATLSRDALVRAVLERNPTVRAAREAWRAALARFPQEIAPPDPMLGYGVAPGALGGRQRGDGHRVELRQPVPFPGKLRLRGEVALAEAEAAAHDHDAARLRLATAASLLYDDYYLVARALEVNAHHRALLGDLGAVARSRYESGEAPLGAPLRAELELADLEREAAALEAESGVTRAQLNALLHRAPELALPSAPARLAALDPGEVDAAAESASALAGRPELRAAEARIRAGDAAVAAAERAFLPDFAVSAAYDGLWEEAALRPFVGVEVELPLQVGRRRAALAEAEALRDRARSERASLESEVRTSVAIGAERVRAARRTLALTRERLLPAARDALAAARAAFETGQETLGEVLESEEALRELELAEHRALAELDRTATELRSATGALPLPEEERP